MVNGLAEDVQGRLSEAGWEALVVGEGLMVYERGLPYLFIKFVNNVTKGLTDADKKQFITINSQYQNAFFALIDGVETKVYGFDFGYFGCFAYIDNLFDFLEIPANDLWEDDIHRRIHNVQRVQHENIIKLYEEYGLISEYTEDSFKEQFAELLNALFYEKYEPSERSLPIEIVEDQGLQWIKTSNAAGGSYEGLHRQFLVTYDEGVTVPFIISMFATIRTSNDPTFGNRNGSTQLNVAMCHTKNIAYNLQLNLNEYVEKLAHEYRVWHSGKRSRFKSEFVKQTVLEEAPHLIDDQSIYLATLPFNGTITKDTFSTLIENLITYSYCRYVADQTYR